MLAFRRPCKACMHLSGFDTAGFNVPRFFARIQCSLTDTSWVLFSMLFTSIYMSFTWLKSRHCVFTQSITCSLLTFDTNLTFLSIWNVTAKRAEFERRGCVISGLMTRLAGYYAQLSLMMIGIDAISHGFLRTPFRNGWPAGCHTVSRKICENNNFQPWYINELVNAKRGVYSNLFVNIVPIMVGTAVYSLIFK